MYVVIIADPIFNFLGKKIACSYNYIKSVTSENFWDILFDIYTPLWTSHIMWNELAFAVFFFFRGFGALIYADMKKKVM
jgi:hypothetical protein